MESDLCIILPAKQNKMKKLLTFCLATVVLLATAILLANNSNSQAIFSSDWTLVKEVGDIKLYTKLESCNRRTRDEQMVHVKVENTGSKSAVVHFHLNQYYDGVCKTCDDPNGEYDAFADVGTGIIML